MLPRLHETTFDWLRWRNGNLLSLLNVQSRTEIIKANASALRDHAIGWCEADNLVCRPKPGYMAVMFTVDEREFWTHLTKEEFDYCFKEIDEKTPLRSL